MVRSAIGVIVAVVTLLARPGVTEGSHGRGGTSMVPGWTITDATSPAEEGAADVKTIRGDTGDPPVNGARFAHCDALCEESKLAIGSGIFSPAAFKFSTIVPDDGQGKAGGWQAATAPLGFVKWTSVLPESWTCTVTVGMPLRTEVHGKISAATAASISAQVATAASATVRAAYPDITGGVFCVKFRAEMTSIFASEAMKSYGARLQG
jgi:hypothetical protein